MTLDEFKGLADIDKHKYISGLEKSGRGTSRALVLGMGVNDVSYSTAPKVGGVQVYDPSAVCWRNMLTRAYSKKEHARNPTYVGTKVCEEWLSLRLFTSWWCEHQVDGFQLDKDLLSNSKTYSPETSLFLPAWVNTITLGCGRARGHLPIGVRLNGKGFTARVNAGGVLRYVGQFDTPEGAYNAWEQAKLKVLLDRKGEIDAIDARIYERLVEMVIEFRDVAQ